VKQKTKLHVKMKQDTAVGIRLWFH